MMSERDSISIVSFGDTAQELAPLTPEEKANGPDSFGRLEGLPHGR